jgi:hypothetical protein
MKAMGRLSEKILSRWRGRTKPRTGNSPHAFIRPQLCVSNSIVSPTTCDEPRPSSFILSFPRMAFRTKDIPVLGDWSRRGLV